MTLPTVLSSLLPFLGTGLLSAPLPWKEDAPDQLPAELSSRTGSLQMPSSLSISLWEPLWSYASPVQGHAMLRAETTQHTLQQALEIQRFLF